MWTSLWADAIAAIGTGRLTLNQVVARVDARPAIPLASACTMRIPRRTPKTRIRARNENLLTERPTLAIPRLCHNAQADLLRKQQVLDSNPSVGSSPSRTKPSTQAGGAGGREGLTPAGIQPSRCRLSAARAWHPSDAGRPTEGRDDVAVRVEGQADLALTAFRPTMAHRSAWLGAWRRTARMYATVRGASPVSALALRNARTSCG